MISHPCQQAWKSAWDLRGDTTYLNHGSFGPSPQPVLQAYRDWQARMENQPMDFFVRIFPEALLAAAGGRENPVFGIKMNDFQMKNHQR